MNLEWDQGLFRAGRALLRRLRAGRREGDPIARDRAAHLDDHVSALTTLARAISGRAVRIAAASDAGGVRGLDLLVPEAIDLAEDPAANRALYVLRVSVAAAIVRLGLNGRSDRPPMTRPVSSTAVAEGCAWLEGEFPGFGERLRLARALGSDLVLFGDHFEPSDERDPGGGATSPVAVDARPRVPGTEASASRVGKVERVALEPDERGDIVWNPFERVETLDEYRGGSRNPDGADDLAAHLEALSEVDLGKLTRGGAPAQALLRADIRLDFDAPEVASDVPTPSGIPYDEWDYRTRTYRRGWCTVYPQKLAAVDTAWTTEAARRHRRRIDELFRRLERQRAGLRGVDRQLDGEDVDLAALVDERAAVRAGLGGDPRLYVRQEHRRRDYATSVLLDVSLSTDAWIQGRRVLDVARDAVFVLGEVAERLGDRLRVLAFASETRNHGYIWEVCGWDEPWSVGRQRLGALSPRGYTRIGPAIRHATADLAAITSERKLLLLISDGKPSDYDHYEGRYGMADVRQALREAESCGLHTHALAVDAVARAWLPELVGTSAWHVLPRPELLPDVLAEVYGRLTLGTH
jgi:nitric oxide reductase NorD protein